MSKLTLQSWERKFRREAKADKLSVLREHLRGLELRAKPQLILEGTIQVVQACLAYMKMEGRSYARFLAMQTYDPWSSPNATYAFTFSLCDKAFARVLVARDLRGLDLADLYGHVWQEYRLVGFTRFWITRADGAELTKRDFVKLERWVRDDLRYDYSEEELDILCTPDWIGDVSAVVVAVVDLKDVVNFLRVSRYMKADKTLQTMKGQHYATR